MNVMNSHDERRIREHFFLKLGGLRIDNEGIAASSEDNVKNVSLQCPLTRNNVDLKNDPPFRWLVTCTEGLLTTWTAAGPSNTEIVKTFAEALKGYFGLLEGEALQRYTDAVGCQ